MTPPYSFGTLIKIIIATKWILLKVKEFRNISFAIRSWICCRLQASHTGIGKQKKREQCGLQSNGDLLSAGPLNSCRVARRGFNKAVTSFGHEMKFWVVLYE
jgi:hypothetical protein